MIAKAGQAVVLPDALRLYEVLPKSPMLDTERRQGRRGASRPRKTLLLRRRKGEKKEERIFVSQSGDLIAEAFTVEVDETSPGRLFGTLFSGVFGLVVSSLLQVVFPVFISFLCMLPLIWIKQTTNQLQLKQSPGDRPYPVGCHSSVFFCFLFLRVLSPILSSIRFIFSSFCSDLRMLISQKVTEQLCIFIFTQYSFSSFHERKCVFSTQYFCYLAAIFVRCFL